MELWIGRLIVRKQVRWQILLAVIDVKVSIMSEYAIQMKQRKSNKLRTKILRVVLGM